jgi:hypothetical protein
MVFRYQRNISHAFMWGIAIRHSNFPKVLAQKNFGARYLSPHRKHDNICVHQRSVSCGAFLFLSIHQLASTCWGVNHN